MGAKARFALLIDAENVQAKSAEFVLSDVARHGVAHVRRAYGDWKNPCLKSWEDRLHDLAIRPIQQFGYTAKKNASDMALVIDAMDLMYAGSVDGIALMSSDADFTPLVMRLLSNGLEVYGYGERKTPSPFVNACSQFTYVDDPPTVDGPASPPVKEPWSGQQLRDDSRLITLLRLAVGASHDENAWVHLATVGSRIGNRASFDPRNYGYQKLSEVIEATGLFELRRDGLNLSVRDRQYT
jgi:uncharacterized protein (TIGR00288 family)